MSATATRPAQAAPDLRQAGVVLAALIIGAALIVAVSLTQQTARSSSVATAGSAPVMHDRGWASTDSAAAPVVHDNGWSATDSTSRAVPRGTTFQKAHAAGAATSAGLVTPGSFGGYISYTGIPYLPRTATGGGSGDARFAQ